MRAATGVTADTAHDTQPQAARKEICDGCYLRSRFADPCRSSRLWASSAADEDSGALRLREKRLGRDEASSRSPLSLSREPRSRSLSSRSRSLSLRSLRSLLSLRSRSLRSLRSPWSRSSRSRSLWEGEGDLLDGEEGEEGLAAATAPGGGPTGGSPGLLRSGGIRGGKPGGMKPPGGGGRKPTGPPGGIPDPGGIGGGGGSPPGGMGGGRTWFPVIGAEAAVEGEELGRLLWRLKKKETGRDGEEGILRC